MLLNLLWIALASTLFTSTNPPVVPPDVAGGAVLVRATGATFTVDDANPAVITWQAKVESDDEDSGNPAKRRQVLFLSTTEPGETLPAVWLGVRITPVPAPLAAHLGARGVMVGNVVVGSPADTVGLQQYDVITQVGDASVNAPGELLHTLASYAAGDTLTLRIIRQGRESTVTLPAVARPAEASQELKFDEPEDVLFNREVRLRGRVLQLGPDGKWLMQDLGQMQQLPDVLQDLDALNFDLKLDLDLPDGSAFSPKGPWIFRSLRDGLHTLALPDGSVDVRLHLFVNRDGTTTRIENDADGRIHVTRVDADGNETTALYDSPEAFKAADPGAYELYDTHLQKGLPDMRQFRPFGHDLRRLRDHFQLDVEKRLREAQELESAARESALQARDQAAQLARELRQHVRTYTRNRDGEVDRTRHQLTLRDDGSIEVRTERDGEVVIYQFESKAAFQAAQPELYSRLMEPLAEE